MKIVTKTNYFVIILSSICGFPLSLKRNTYFVVVKKYLINRIKALDGTYPK